jgi:hypothetical protein
MAENQILIGAQRQAELEAAKAAFFKSGGQVEQLEGFTFKPMPKRQHPDSKPKIPKSVQDGLRQQRSKERAALIAEMAQSMTCREVSQSLGIPQNTLYTMAQREDFTFAPDLRGKRKSPYTDRASDEKMAERITALRDAGLTRHQVEKQIGIGNGVLKRILNDFEIDFPKFRDRKASGVGNEQAQA